MKHVGNILREHIESHRLVQRKLAEQIGITPAYMSSILSKGSIDCALLERICVTLGLDPLSFFDYTPSAVNNSHNEANTIIGNSTVSVGADNSDLKKLLAEKERLLAEKERTIQILLGAYSPTPTATNSEHRTTL